MQVADIQGAATAATLGAQATIAVGMVEDASFLIMMATNLYSNQQLAPIREVLCNAWDAHIEAGTTGTPIKVTITAENELIVEDSGNGIPDEAFPKVYGTLGGSTKKTNLMVTGGFGLGAKSPWAYVDSFRVINENQGVKTVYNLVKASVENEGKPAIQPVMSVPTDRTGLTVRFQLEAKDVEQMVKYIQAVAMHGDMNVMFTRPNVSEVKLDPMNLATEVGSYNVNDSQWYFPYMGNHTLFVRYGAVIYPMLQTPGTQKAVDLLKQFMELVGFRRMVVQAAPGSLALTPNREALSSSKMTEDGITDLCVALVARIEEDLIKQIPASILAAVAQLSSGEGDFIGLGQYARVIDSVHPLPVRRYLASQLGAAKYAKYEKMLKDAEHRGFKVKHTMSNRAATHEYHRLRRRMADKNWTARDDMKKAFVKHFILRPLSRVFQKHAELLKLSEIHHSRVLCGGLREKKRLLMELVNAEEFGHVKQLIDTPTVFITSRLKNVKASLESCPDVLHEGATWLYHIAPKDMRREAIIKAFEDTGYKVIDLTLNHSWDCVATELEIRKLNRVATRRKNAGQLDLPVGSAKRTNLLMSLCNVYDDTGKRKMGIERIKLMKADLETTDTPLFYVALDDLDRLGKLGRFGSYQDLTDEERKLGVVVRTGTEKNMALKRNAVHVDNYLAKRLWDQAHSKEYETYRRKQRKAGLFEEFHIDEDYVALVEYLGIKLPGLDKLTNDPVMERVATFIDGLSSSLFSSYIPGLTMDQLQHYREVIKKLHLDEMPFVKKLTALRQDWMFQRLFMGSSTALEDFKQYPDRKAALKSLVMSVFKNGN